MFCLFPTASETTTIADNFQIGFPIGLTFKGQGRMALDLEMVPSISFRCKV